MRNVWIVAQKEFKHFIISPIAYVIGLGILLFMGIYFYANVVYSAQQQQAPSVQIILGPLVTLLIFAAPAITMRAVAEEQKNGTLEILLTAPVRDWEVVVGKWLGNLLFMVVLLALTWFFPIVLNQIVKPGIDQGLMTAGYLGLLLLSSSLMAIGVMTSSFFSNQIAAFLASLGVILVLLVISFPAQAMGASGSQLLTYLSIGDHFYNNFYRGVVELKDVVYYLSLTSLALFIGTVSVESRRWR